MNPRHCSTGLGDFTGTSANQNGQPADQRAGWGAQPHFAWMPCKWTAFANREKIQKKTDISRDLRGLVKDRAEIQNGTNNSERASSLYLYLRLQTVILE